MFVFQALNEVREQSDKWLKVQRRTTTGVSGPHDTQGISSNQNLEVSTYDWS